MLEDLGHAVLEATSGEQALRILRRAEPIDLVITDQMMPSMTGARLVEAIRSEHAEMPVIPRQRLCRVARGNGGRGDAPGQAGRACPRFSDEPAA